MAQFPYAIGPRLLVARSLLEQHQEYLALPHLELLSSLRCAEAAYFLGVIANRHGDYETAMRHMRRAQELNPCHEPTLQQIEALQKLLNGENGGEN
jgi:Flp pilus assembly protein TadD